MDGQFLQAALWLWSPILDGQTQVHFGQVMFGLRMTGMLLALSVSSYVFPLRLQASLPRTYDWLFSLMNANCLGLRPPAAIIDG